MEIIMGLMAHLLVIRTGQVAQQRERESVVSRWARKQAMRTQLASSFKLQN